jgi:poly-gamma-glutamate synthesis protein (capsule biosynthesis protein)
MKKGLRISLVLITAGLGLAAALFVVRTYELPPQFSFKTEVIKNEHKPVKTSVFLAGDVMLSRNVGTKIAQANDPALPFKGVSDVIKSADISFANLESPFSDKGPRVTQGLIFKAEPAWVEGLTFAGFDVMSTANNHAFDQGAYGIGYTLKHLKDNGISPVGSGTECHKGAVISRNGLRVGFLAYSYAAHNDGGKIPDPMVCDWQDKEQMALDIASLKKVSDFVIVSGQYGVEYKREPEPGDVAIARSAVDAGADMVIGHHPHWVQVTEKYKGKWILYSIGNFVFDQMWSQDTREGFGVLLSFEDKSLKSAELKPVIIDNFCCPRWANPDESVKILNKIGLTSGMLSINN